MNGTTAFMKSAFSPLWLVLILAGCTTPYDSLPQSRHDSQIALESPGGAPLDLSLADEHLNWSLSLPGEVTAIPALRDRIIASATKERDELIEAAKEDRAYRLSQNYPFRPYTLSTRVGVAGETGQLLSLAISFDVYSGGAHPNHGTGALLWDKAAGDEIRWRQLFANGAAAAAALHAAFCPKLDEMRAKRRGVVLKGEGSFTDCPPLEELAVIPADEDGDGLLDALIVHADPYVAGPYAEGDYDLVMAMPAAIAPRFALSVAPQLQ